MNINVSRFVLAALAIFVFLFLFEYIVHGVLLMQTYEQTPQVWRPFAEMEANMIYSILYQLAIAFWLAYVFTKIYPEAGIKNGLRLGIFFGIFAALIVSSWYLVLPVVPLLGWSWFASALAEIIGAGLIWGAIYHK